MRVYVVTFIGDGETYGFVDRVFLNEKDAHTYADALNGNPAFFGKHVVEPHDVN